VRWLALGIGIEMENNLLLCRQQPSSLIAICFVFIFIVETEQLSLFEVSGQATAPMVVTATTGCNLAVQGFSVM